MVRQLQIKNLLSKMKVDSKSNIKEIKKVFGSLNYNDNSSQTLLHIFVDNLYNETDCLLAINSLLLHNINPNFKDDYGYNFIQTALYAGYSEDFILDIIKLALKQGLDVNHVDSDKDTIMHTAIYSDDYNGGLINIYNLLCENGFDSNKLDGSGRNLLQAMEYQSQESGKYTKDEIEEFKKLFLSRTDNQQGNFIYSSINVSKDNKTYTRKVTDVPVEKKLSGKDIDELEEYGKVLNKKNYLTAPTIGRDKELKSLLISLAQDKKNPIIVGESGVGKTAIVEELAYRVKNGEVPSFLKDKIILKVNPGDVVAGCKYVGQFEESMKNLMELCQKNDVIVFIDEIHTIYGVGSSERKSTDMAAMLKYYIDRTDLKVIGTTTKDEYQEFFTSDSLKRRFDKITVLEPDEKVLYQILDKVINDYTLKTGLSLENDSLKDEIINIIISVTDKQHRVYDDLVNNPDLAISIIDRAFAIARVEDSEVIKIEHFIESFEFCERIYEQAKQGAISELKNLDGENLNRKTKILKINFINKNK